MQKCNQTEVQVKQINKRTAANLISDFVSAHCACTQCATAEDGNIM